LWGSATAPYQIEGGLSGTDWARWEAMPMRIAGGHRADDGPRSFTHFEADLDALVATHQNAYRLGFDWWRLFPTREGWQRCREARARPRDEFRTACRAAASVEGVRYYHRVLEAMASRRLTPMVTLHHFVFPAYLNDLSMPAATQGFANDAIADDFMAFARFVGGEYGREVDWWVTINEPFAYVAGGYLQTNFPPAAPFDAPLVLRVVRNMIRAHAAAYDALHESDTERAGGGGDAGAGAAARVSIAAHNRVWRPLRAESEDDVAAARHVGYLNNLLFLNAIVRGDTDNDGDGSLDGPLDRRGDPALRGRADWIGINYYGLALVRGLRTFPLLRGIPMLSSLPTDLPKSDLDWDLYPQGFTEVLHEAAQYGLPIIVTENGVADAAGTSRPRFLAEHLAALAAAVRAGDRILGYFHWSIVDNFEWHEGYCPRFGLYRVDYDNPLRPRTPTPAAETFRRIIDANEVSDALLGSLPPYGVPRLCHPR
jgi:beta-glucosidase